MNDPHLMIIIQIRLLNGSKEQFLKERQLICGNRGHLVFGECESHLIFTLNNVPTQEVKVGNKTEYWSSREVLEGKKRHFNLLYLHAFGSACVCYLPKEQRKDKKTPTQRKAFDGVIVGYVPDMDAYRVWDLSAQKIREVSFAFTIVQEGFFPLRDKKQWAQTFLSDPTNFYPDEKAVLLKREWERFGFDEEDAEEALQDYEDVFKEKEQNLVEPEERTLIDVELDNDNYEMFIVEQRNVKAACAGVEEKIFSV